MLILSPIIIKGIDSFVKKKTALRVEMIHCCYSKMVLWFYYCIHIFKIIYMLLNSGTMVGAILIEICTSAPYRPGLWLLSDVTPKPQVGGDLHIWFRCDVITLISHQRAL